MIFFEIKPIFERIFHTLNITIFGYSAPKTDIEALTMIKNAYGNYNERPLEQFEIIDIRDKDEVISSWSEIAHPNHLNKFSK